MRIMLAALVAGGRVRAGRGAVKATAQTRWHGPATAST